LYDKIITNLGVKVVWIIFYIFILSIFINHKIG
jgi:hypothetical protein